MRLTLRYLGAIPRQGVRHVRIHYLLDLVTAKGLDSESPCYDWSKLDQGLDALVENRLVSDNRGRIPQYQVTPLDAWGRSPT